MYRKPVSHTLFSLLIVASLTVQPLMAQPALGRAAPLPVPAPSTASAAATTAPEAAEPLVVVKAQSTFTAGGLLAVTYTLRNGLPPTLRPEVAPGADVTATTASLLATDFAADPNVIHGASLALHLTDPDTHFHSASLPVDQQGAGVAVNLGDLPPLGEASVTITLTTPANAADFTDLDTGAAAYGAWRGRAVQAQAGAIRLAPDGLDQWLACTPDANCADPIVQRQAGVVGQDPLALFAFVQELAYESYPGSLRGARGTLWSAAGNGYDQASLLIALLRASGIPAAYRLGALSQGAAQTLIASMFPPVAAVSGLVPAGTATADPANDPALTAEAQDHAWVEAYLPGSGWTTLDPSFAAAAVGQVFGTPAGGQLVELPDAVRHKVTLSLEVEKYRAFPVGGTNLYRVYPLTATLNTVELVGEPVVFAHLVASSTPAGLVFATAEHTYTPYFIVGTAEALIEGQAFGELISSFPFAQDFVVAEWLNLTTTDPNGNSETYQRELFDDIGFAVRTGGGLLDDLARDGTARVSLMSSWTTLFSPSAVPLDALNDTYQAMVALALDGIAANAAIAGVPDTDNPTPEMVALGTATATTFGLLARLAQRQHLLQYAVAADQAHAALAETLLVRAYPDSPRIFTVGWERDDTTQTEHIAFDLARNPLRALAYPGQTDVGRQAFAFWRGLLDMSLEHQLLAAIAPEPVVSVAAVFNQAIADNLEFERITPGTLAELGALPVSDQAKARISTALADNPNLFILVPAAMVTLPGAGEPTIGWIQVDQVTLDVVDVMENGQHTAAVEYDALAQFSVKIASFLGGFAAGFFGHTIGFWIGFFQAMPLGSKDIGAAIADGKATAAEWGNKANEACNEKADEEWCKRGVAAGNALGAAVIGEDPPLQEALFNLPVEAPTGTAQASATVAEAATLSGSSVSANLTTALVGVHGAADFTWTGGAANSFAFEQLTLSAAQVYSGGALLASGPVLAAPANGGPAVAVVEAGVSVTGAADGTLALHAPAWDDLGAGSQWASYAFELDAAGSYTLALTGATVNVNGSNYVGNFELLTSSPATLTGTGATAAPDFAAEVDVTAAGTGFTLADASGTLTVGGNPAPAGHGFALGNASGAASVSPAGAAADTFTFTGTADFFAVTLDQTASAIPANGLASFDADLAANFAGTYTVTVLAPAGWDVSVDSAGQVTAAPPRGAAPDDYVLIVTAQSPAYPALAASAEHTVTLTGVDGVQVSVALDQLITVPWGPAHPVINFDPAVGRVQLTGAAFAATITNTSSSARTFDVAVTGLPSGWSILGGEPGNEALTLALAAGEVVRLGLYISPTVASLPTAGTNYPFDMTATAQDNGSVTADDAGLFIMPAVAYPALSVNPAELFTASNSDAVFELTVTNIGNTAGDFDLAGTVPAAGWGLTALQTPVSLAPGAAATQLVTVSVTVGDAGVDYPVAIGAGVPGMPYTPTTAVNVYVVGPLSSPVFQAGRRVAAECPANWGSLAAALETLALSMSSLEGTCADGNCVLPLRDVVVANLEGAAYYANAASPLVTTAAALQTLATTMAGHTTDVDLEADLAAIGAAVEDLSAEVCEICQHQPAVTWSPVYDAGLPGLPVTYTLEIENQGTVTTTYAVTLTLPAGSDTFTTTLASGATDVVDVAVSAAGLGLHDLTAAVTAIGPEVTVPDLTAGALARLNVVDRFVQITAVTADPAFVETGVSSTTLSVDVTNVANVARAATAHTTILAPGGGLSHTTDVTLTVLVGAPRTYALGAVDTSGWAAGVYTVAVELRDGADALIPDGSGYTYFAVGQALVAGHAVSPTVVAPGAVTVTTSITTAVQSDLPFPPEQGGGAASTAIRGAPPADPASWSPARPQHALVAAPAAVPPAQPLFATPGLTRTEQTSPTITYTGTWTLVSNSRASGGSYYRADDPGETAVFTYTGAWLNLGFFGGPASGQAEVFIDGLSQGVVDLYRREETPLSVVYSGFVTGTHTLSVTVLGASNVHASNDRVQLDYVDVWDGTALPDGVFEQDDGRVYLTSSWGNAVSNGAASGGTYVRDASATAWFIFTGDSVTYQAIAANNNGWAQVYLDGQYQTDLYLYSSTLITRSLSFTGLGAGPHILQVSTYRGTSTLDAFSTPGSAPFYTPAAPSGFTRFEDDNPAVLYNGVPFTQTADTWGRSIDSVLVAGWASKGQWIGSDTLGDTVSLTFDGVWVSVGFSGEGEAGRAEIFIDGVSQGVVDLYRNEPDAISFTYANLVTGTHTVSVTVLASANPLASADEVRLDYIDVWDGTDLPDGVFQETDSRVMRSTGWDDTSDANAGGGVYMEEGLSSNATAWFAFTGDSVTYQALDYFRSNEVVLRLDGAFVQYADLYTTQAPTLTFNFDGLGAGLHIVQVRHYRSEANVDAFITPAIGAPAPPATPTVFTRWEEDNPVLLYNGLPYTLSARSWDRQDDVTYASDGQYFHTAAVSDSVSFGFTGTWVRAGFITDRFGGHVEVFIDGVSQGMVDLYTRDADVTAVTFDGLADTSHTISVTLLSTQHPNASDNRLYVDYFDTWDGTPLTPGTYEEDDALVWRSDQSENWTTTADAGASGGAYLRRGSLSPDGTLWFPFTGDSITYQAMATSDGGRVTLSIDDVPQGTFNLYNRTAVSRTFSFEGLGAGPHVLEARYYQFPPTLDALVVPGMAPFFATPVYTGVVRYEEDHVALAYGGYTFAQRPQTWTLATGSTQVSGGRHVSNGTPGSAVSLTFSGRWVSVGFRTRNETGSAEVFIDGVSQGVVNLDNDASEDVASFDYPDLITGTHTISVAVVSGAVYFDYFDVWDGEAMPDGYVNAARAEDSGRLHLSSSMGDVGDAQGFGGDFLAGSLLNVNANVWYSFVGDSFTYLAFSRSGGGTALVYVDNVLVDTVDITYPFTQQPLAFHYSGFGEGPHTVRVSNGLNFRMDAFASNPASLAPYQPIAEWWDDTGKGNGAPFAGTFGIVTAMAVGDVDGDGTVEIVAAADDTLNWGTLFLYRGDGADTGDGDPILWERVFGAGFAGRANLGSPAIADLDGLPGAEIVVAGSMGLYALYNDGTTYWYTDTVEGLLARGTPAIGNLDLDPEPEIVINLDQTLAVFEHDGTLAWSTTYTTEAGLPLLADLTGDGLLDIVAYDWAGHVYLYDFNYGSPTLEWTVTLSSSTSSLFGSPAVGDIDGQQPGGDDGPEIAITSDGLHTVLDADGSVVFTATLGAGVPGGVSIADVDGDGEVEIVTGTRYDDGIGEGRLYVLNADGSLLWEAPAYDSTSANSAAVLDLDGDGVYEIAWNGKEQGFTIFNGADGAVIFNEPLALSYTATDYPAIVDVDNDGFAEIVAPTLNGLVVFGNDHAWTAARPVWNQHSYHITNINDNLSVPASELNSWEAHNTYRTQWAGAVVLPAYDVSLAHTAGGAGVTVLTDSFNVTPTVAADPLYGWDYTQTWADAVITRTFTSLLTDLQPGEARLVAEGTIVTYTLPSGNNHLTLPPLYVSVPHIVALAPETRTVGAGGVVTYAVQLSNPAASADTYTLTVSGVPGGWVALPASVPVGGQSAVTATLTLTVPAATAPADLLIVVTAENAAGGSDQAAAELDVIDALAVALTPATQSAETGALAAYTLTVTNHEAIARTYALSALGLATVSLPPTVTVAANASEQVVVLVSAVAEGPHPYTVLAETAGAGAAAEGQLEVSGQRAVGLDLAPPAQFAGPGSTAGYTLTVTNLGSAVDAYDLSVDLPAGWTAVLAVNGAPVSAVSLPPDLFNTAEVHLAVTPDASAAPGVYEVGVLAQSQTLPGVTAAVTGTLEVLTRGVQVALSPAETTLDLGQATALQLTITNTGSVADTFDLTLTGLAGLAGTLSANPVSLDPGAATTVDLTLAGLDFVLPGSYPVGVAAVSQGDDRVQAEATTLVTYSGQEAVQVGWVVNAVEVFDTLSAGFVLVITNTGNLSANYDLSLALPALSGGPLPASVRIPAHQTVAVPVWVTAAGAGVYALEATAASDSSAAQASASATLTITVTGTPPSVNAGAPQSVSEGDLVSFSGSATDVDGGPLELAWQFGDGMGAFGVLTPTHTYADDGVFLVTLAVTDATSLHTAAVVTVTVTNAPPVLATSADQAAQTSVLYTLLPVSFTDAGSADTHTASLDWGDGAVTAGTVNQGALTAGGSHVYTAAGEYLVTLTLTDDDGDSDTLTLTITVTGVSDRQYLPFVQVP